MSHAHTPAPAAVPGELVLGRYRLGQRLGAGGMGVVHLARDERLERDVAVKRVAVEHDPDGRGEREALAAARLSHPGIVALYESGRDDQAVYLVSELVCGRTLADLERHGELSDRRVLEIGATLCGALEHAHARGVVHRDVKPSNVICPDVPEQGGGVAKLTDFGIARMADGEMLTRTGDIIGTLAYMAPEQARGERLDGAADVYALGIVLYEALAGVNPVRAGNPAATARRVGMRLPPLGRVRRDLPPALCRAIDAAVLPGPRERTTLAALRAELVAAAPLVSDVEGPIAGADVAGAAVRARTDVTRRRRAPRRLRSDPRRRLPAPSDDGEPAARPSRPALRARAAAAAGLAALAAAALAWLASDPPLQPIAGAGVAGVAALVAPRLGWLLVTLALTAWLAVAAPGVGLLLAVAAAPVPLLLPRRGTAWPAPALAPLLGAIGLAGAWPALAGQAAGWPARAALGALGGWWLAIAEALSSERLLAGPAADVLPPSAWEDSALDAARDALWPLLPAGVLAFAALWALAAVVLPLLVRGRSAAADLVAATGWAAALAVATQALAEGLALDAPRGLALGAVAAGAVAVAARAIRGRA